MIQDACFTSKMIVTRRRKREPAWEAGVSLTTRSATLEGFLIRPVKQLSLHLIGQPNSKAAGNCGFYGCYLIMPDNKGSVSQSDERMLSTWRESNAGHKVLST